MSEQADPVREDFEAGLRRLNSYTTSPRRALELFDAARGTCPVAHSDEHDGFHVLLAYEDVKKGTADAELFSSQPQIVRPLLPHKPIPALEMDPPQHRHWRVLFNQAVSPKAIRTVEDQIRGDVNRHIDAFVERGSADLVPELAAPVPAEAICHLVGLDEELVPTVRDRAIAMFAAMGDPEEFAQRMGEFAAIAIGEVNKRKAEPRDDYLTYLATVEVEDRELDDGDYAVLLGAFLGAGHHSTSSAMASAIYEVFRDPALKRRLIEDPSAIPAAVEEALRLHPPFYGFFRRATANTEVKGVEIEAGDDVYMAWASANRDPDAFPDPAIFSLDRERVRHLSFGFGPHTCPGAPLARQEIRIAIEELLRRIPDLKVELEAPEYEFGGGEYCFPVELPVSFAPRPATPSPAR